MSTSIIAEIQTRLGVVADGIWGPKSQDALIKSKPAVKRGIQTLLGVTVDGQWGPNSQAALNVAAGSADAFVCDASSFADPADVLAFQKCKRTGKSDIACFAVGDNGIGQFGKITAQEHTPMVAVHGAAMKARWGSVQGAAHRPVQVTANGLTINATVEDRISAKGRIDLNPAAAELLGLKPPFVVPARWSWV